MEQSVLPQSEQEVIDNFDIKLVRGDDISKEDQAKIKSFFSQNFFNDLEIMLFNFFFLQNINYIVLDGHIVAINFIGSPIKPHMIVLSENLGNLSELIYLEICDTKIERIPSSIGKLKKLFFLRIYNNPNLVSLPENLGAISNLRKLFLSNNYLASLPESIGYLSYLWEIILNNNKLMIFPESFKKLVLFEIEIRGNPLRSLSNINFEKIFKYNMSIGDLTEKGKNLLKYWDDESFHIQDRKEFIYMQYSQNNFNSRNFRPVTDYYNKSPLQLAEQYCDDSASLSTDEKKRLIWESNSSIREILELFFPADNEIIKKINDRLSFNLSSDYNIKF